MIIALENVKARLLAVQDSVMELENEMAIPAIRQQRDELQARANEPDFWEKSAAESQSVLQKIKNSTDKIESYERLRKSYDAALELTEMAIEAEDESVAEEVEREATAIERDLELLRLAALLSGEYDANNAIMTIHPGAGGTEAQDWAQMLYRMYLRWAERKGYKTKVLDYLDGEEAGIKSVTLTISGTNAYGFLKSETGVHRLVRVSPFDSSGRRHTSFASVEVMPEFTEDAKIEIREEDIRVETHRSSGAGGQHVNKTESAVRIIHIPTGIITACQNERSQHQNKEVALNMLKSKLMEIKEREKLDKIEDIKGEQREIAWGSQIRSYVFMPYTLAKDHRTGFENGNIGAVMDGDLDGFINSYLKDQNSK
ncbi:MAG: peptide chain release factor 2 [Clostridia bacterium]|nr:peptide chain release factor 2 [Clostridia bacterium]